ncbi:MAG: hypothetical protein IJ549_06005 [Prevotella sp.]|nr:hypothetical protein [Prevotella sp.]
MEEKKSKWATVEEIKAFIRKQMMVRWNVVSGSVECQWIQPPDFAEPEDNITWEKYDWHDLTDRDENTLWVRMSMERECRLSDIGNVIRSEYTVGYNPIRDYLDALPVWNRDRNYVEDLARHVHVIPADGETKEDAQRRFRQYLTKWLMGLVAGIMDKEVVNNMILVLVGEQGIYKTTFFNNLLPPVLRRYFHTKPNADRLTKDDRINMSRFWLICMEELDTMTPSEMNQLKAMVTMRTINERPAYGRNVVTYPHIASFCGTGNNTQFLNDPTGTRRWLPVEVSSIDPPDEWFLDYDGLYSQIKSMYMTGYQYWFDEEETQILQQRNRVFEAVNMEQELIEKYYCSPDGGEGRWVSTAEIIEKIGRNMRLRMTPIKVGVAMKRLGYLAKRTNTGTKYLVKTVEKSAASDV